MNERLTSSAATTYAKDGELFMAAENTKDQENRHWDPVDTPLSNVIDIMDIPAKTAAQIKAKAAWSQLYGGKLPSDPDERQTLNQLIKDGITPDSSAKQGVGKQSGEERSEDRVRDIQQERRRRRPQIEEGEELDEEMDESEEENSSQRNISTIAKEPQIRSNMSEEQKRESIDHWVTGMEARLGQQIHTPEAQRDQGYIRSMGRDLESLRRWASDPTTYTALSTEYAHQLSSYSRREQAIKNLEQQGFRRNEITEEQIKVMEDYVEESLTTPMRIQRLKDQIMKATEVKDARNKFQWLRNYLHDILESEAAGKLKLKDETSRVLHEVANLGEEDLSTLEDIKAQTERIVADPHKGINIRTFFTETETTNRRGRLQIKSLEDLVELIAESQGGDFSPGGQYEIMNERGEIQLQNLVAWIRKRIIDSHEADPDSAINILNRVRVPTFTREITLDEMLFLPAYFQKRKRIIQGSEADGTITMRQESSDDADYTRFKLDLLYESWLFGVSHSNNAEYFNVRTSEEGLFNKITSIYSQNQFTKDRNRFLNIFNLAKIDKDEFEKVGRKEDQGSVGKAIQRSLMAYYHLWELVRENEYELDKNGDPKKDRNGKEIIKGEDVTKLENNSFYSTLGADGTKYFYQSMINTLLEKKGETDLAFRDTFGALIKTEEGRPLDRTVEEESLIDLEFALLRNKDKVQELFAEKFGLTTEQIAAYESNPRVLAEILLKKIWNFQHKDLNIFNDVGKEQRLISLVSTAITEAVGKKEGLGKDDRKYAGAWAFTMRNWTGIAAHNDTGGIGFDAWSKLINFQDYRRRQGKGRSGAGNIYNFPGFKRISVNLLEGLMVKVEGEDKERALIDVLSDSVKKDERLKTFDFNGQAMSQFAGNHINNSYKIFQFILEKMETKMNSIVSVDKSGRPVFNHEAALQIMDGLWHDLRYAFDQPRFNYDGVRIEGWENRVQYDKKGNPIIDEETGEIKTKLVKAKNKDGKDQTMREYMFGEEVIELGHKMHHRKITHDKWKNQMGRSAFAYLIAKEIKSHRDWDSGYVRWPVEQIELIQAFFHHQALEFGQKGEHDYDMKIFETFFDHHEWNEILKLAKSSYRRMYGEEYLLQGTSLLGGMIGKTVGETIKQVSTIAK